MSFIYLWKKKYYEVVKVRVLFTIIYEFVTIDLFHLIILYENHI